jgi:phosphatidylethanolamine-binding protein (PEBP) family uncharacterized protein
VFAVAFESAPQKAARLMAIVAVAVIAGVAGCSMPTEPTAGPTATTAAPTAVSSIGTFELTSTAYVDGGTIPDKYSCNGDGISPPLAWQGAPASTVAMVLIMQDLTSNLTQWIVVNVPGAESGSFSEGYSRSPAAPVQPVPYIAPCPSKGMSDRYHLTLYALSAHVVTGDLSKMVNELKQVAVQDAMAGRILAEGNLEASWTNTATN